MARPRNTELTERVLEVLRARGPLTIRGVQEAAVLSYQTATNTLVSLAAWEQVQVVGSVPRAGRPASLFAVTEPHPEARCDVSAALHNCMATWVRGRP